MDGDFDLTLGLRGISLVGILSIRKIPKLTIKAAAKAEGKTTFKDSDKISQYAKEAIENFSLSQIINGYDDGSFKPQNSIKREEAAKILFEWINKALIQ